MSGFGNYGGGGGGFMPTQGGGGGFDPNSTQPQAPKQRTNQTLTPMTIRQLQNGTIEDGKVMVDGKEIGQVSIVGTVQSQEARQTHKQYTIDDGSGQIVVRIYTEIGDSSAEEIPTYSYVKVYGNIRATNTQNQNPNAGDSMQSKPITANSLVPITDHNEITFHMADVIATHLRNTEQAPSQQQQGQTPGQYGQQSNGGFGQQQNNYGGQSGMQVDGAYQGGQQQHQQMNGGGAAESIAGINTQGWDPQHREVFRAFSTIHSGDEGVSVSQVVNQLSRYSEQQVRRSIEWLTDEGHLYSTVDDDHYKSTGAL